MNRYPKWWNDTITVFNKYEDPQTSVITWYPTILTGVFWQYIRDKVIVGETELLSEKTICRIPKNDKFLEKWEWIKIPNDEMNQYFTLGRGDIIVRGEAYDEIDENVDGQRSTDIIEKYKDLQGCIEIESISINIGVFRNEEHYLVEGI